MESTRSYRNNEYVREEVQMYFENFKNRRNSFNYLLLDPRITENIPAKINITQLYQPGFYEKFKKSIFFVGKGNFKNINLSLHEACILWKQNIRKSDNPKTQHILDIWSDNYGVICLQVFQNTLVEESATYEAALIDFIGLSNLKNEEVSECNHAIPSWSQEVSRELGSCLIRDAYFIYVANDEQQLRPENIRIKIKNNLQHNIKFS